MAHLQVADGTDVVRIRRVAANILNQQSRTDGVGWSYILRVWASGGPKKYKLLLNGIGSLEPGQILWNYCLA